MYQNNLQVQPFKDGMLGTQSVADSSVKQGLSTVRLPQADHICPCNVYRDTTPLFLWELLHCTRLSSAPGSPVVYAQGTRCASGQCLRKGCSEMHPSLSAVYSVTLFMMQSIVRSVNSNVAAAEVHAYGSALRIMCLMILNAA